MDLLEAIDRIEQLTERPVFVLARNTSNEIKPTTRIGDRPRRGSPPPRLPVLLRVRDGLHRLPETVGRRLWETRSLRRTLQREERLRGLEKLNSPTAMLTELDHEMVQQRGICRKNRHSRT